MLEILSEIIYAPATPKNSSFILVPSWKIFVFLDGHYEGIGNPDYGNQVSWVCVNNRASFTLKTEEDILAMSMCYPDEATKLREAIYRAQVICQNIGENI